MKQCIRCSTKLDEDGNCPSHYCRTREKRLKEKLKHLKEISKKENLNAMKPH